MEQQLSRSLQLVQAGFEPDQFDAFLDEKFLRSGSGGCMGVGETFGIETAVQLPGDPLFCHPVSLPPPKWDFTPTSVIGRRKLRSQFLIGGNLLVGRFSVRQRKQKSKGTDTSE